jgi:hypothetical protein
MNLFEMIYALIIVEAFFYEFRKTMREYFKEKRKKK